MSSEIENQNYNILPPPPPNQQTESTEPTDTTSHTQSNTDHTFLGGQFLYINDLYSREMLINAWNAITELDLWNYMRNEQYSYMLSNDKEIYIISRKMEELGYNGHSGFSFGWTMRQMQYIAQFGEKKYAETILYQIQEQLVNNIDECICINGVNT